MQKHECRHHKKVAGENRKKKNPSATSLTGDSNGQRTEKVTLTAGMSRIVDVTRGNRSVGR